MIKKLNFWISGILLFVFLGLNSCKKEDEPETSAQYLAEDIQSVMDSENAQRLVCLDYGTNFNNLGLSSGSSYGTDFLFRDEIVFCEGQYFNLNQLIMYEVRKSSDDTKYMVLYF